MSKSKEPRRAIAKRITDLADQYHQELPDRLASPVELSEADRWARGVLETLTPEQMIAVSHLFNGLVLLALDARKGQQILMDAIATAAQKDADNAQRATVGASNTRASRRAVMVDLAREAITQAGKDKHLRFLRFGNLFHGQNEKRKRDGEEPWESPKKSAVYGYFKDAKDAMKKNSSFDS